MTNYNFNDLMEITARLRGTDGCPWDREQTHKSLTGCMVEEAYEVVEAIDNEDDKNLCEELGDVLLQVTMHTQIAIEEEAFSMEDVTSGICEKLIRRHPHVFGTGKANNSKEVLDNWDEIKKAEKSEKTDLEGILRIPLALPACIRAQKLQKKAVKVGYLDQSIKDTLDNIKDMTNQLSEVDDPCAKVGTDELIGDMLFQILLAAQSLHVDGEEALARKVKAYMEDLKQMV